MIAEVLDQREILPDDIIRMQLGPSCAAFSELTVGEVSLVFVSRIPCVHASKRQFPSVTVSDDCLSTALNKENFACELKLFAKPKGL